MLIDYCDVVRDLSFSCKSNFSRWLLSRFTPIIFNTIKLFFFFLKNNNKNYCYVEIYKYVENFISRRFFQ